MSPAGEQEIEVLVLLLVFGGLLFVASEILLEHHITHAFPYGFYAMDGTTHLAFTTVLYEDGTLQYLPPFMAAGHEQVLSANPPVVYFLAVSLGYVAGLQPYDALVLIELLVLLLCVFIMYLLIRRFNSQVALLSLPLSSLLLINPYFSALSWGEYPFLLGILLLQGGLLLLPLLHLPSSYVLIALIFSALFLAHASEFVVLVGFIILFLLISWWWRRDVKPMVKNAVIAVVITAVLLFDYYFIFKNTFVKLQLQTSFKPIFTAGYLVPEFLKDFPLFMILIILGGTLLSIFMVFSSFQKKNDTWLVPALALLLFLITYSNLIGQKRALQMRLVWPILLMFFCGILLYSFLSKIPLIKNHSMMAMFALIFFFGLLVYYQQDFVSPGLFDQYTWDSFQWVKQNLPNDTSLLFFHGDAYNQHTMLFLAGKHAFRVNSNDQASKAAQNTLSRTFTIQPEVFLDTWLPYRKSFFNFGYYYSENESRYQPAEKDICSFDYFVFNKFSRVEALANHNIALAQKLLDTKKGSVVYDNALVVVIQNKAVGGECL